MTRIFLHPGLVRSSSDGDTHKIGAMELARLYGVDYSECVVIRSEKDCGYSPHAHDIHLYPRSDGNYVTPIDREKERQALYLRLLQGLISQEDYDSQIESEE